MFYGDQKQAADFVEGRPCNTVMRGCRTVPKSELIPVMKSAAVLLHLSVAGAKGIMTSKVTEYLAAGPPILTVPGDGDVVDALLRDTGAGESCADVNSAFAFLLNRYEAWTASGPQVTASTTADLQRFSRRHQCEKLARHLQSLTDSSMNCDSKNSAIRNEPEGSPSRLIRKAG